MVKQLSNSLLDRKNILNNPFAVELIQTEVGFKGIRFDGEYKYTARQLASFFEVDLRTIERYVSDHSDELRHNGYEVINGKKLQEFKKSLGTDIDVGTKTTVLGVFNFKAFLNLGMLLEESERAKILRSLILNIVIDVVSAKAGGSTKYINQRDEGYLLSLYMGERYRKEFTNALRDCVEMGHIKYAFYADKIYNSIFKERGKEYKTILNLSQKEKVRDTMYSEILTTISMYETGLAFEIVKKYKELDRKLKPDEVDAIFDEFENQPAWVPQIETVRVKMASRDYGLRSIIHPELSNYINPLDSADFEKFLGEKSKELSERVEEYQDVFKRLKDK